MESQASVKTFRPTGTVPRVGARVEVYWEQDDMWYVASVVRTVDVAGTHSGKVYNQTSFTLLSSMLTNCLSLIVLALVS